MPSLTKKAKAQQNVARRKRALRQRLLDMLAGALSGDPRDFEINGQIKLGNLGSLPILVFRDWLMAMSATWGPKHGDKRNLRAHLFTIYNIDEYNTLDNATEFLYRHGVRA